VTRVGIAFQTDKRPGEYAHLGRLAEDAGVDVVSVYADLMYQPPLPALIEIAGATERVGLGPACLNPYTTHPYEIAGFVATLDAVSGGRAYLGLARGSWLGSIGVAQPDPVGHIAETWKVVERLLERDGGGFEGRHFRIEPGERLRYPPLRDRIPLLIGSCGPRTLRLAGAIATEAKVGGSANPAMVAVARRRLAVGSVEAGRAADAVGIVMGAVSAVDEDGEAARALARREVAMYLVVVAELDPTFALDPALIEAVRTELAAGDPDAAGALIPDQVLDRFAFSGTPEQVVDQANALYAAGASRVEFGTPHGLTSEAGVDLIGRRVLPLLTARTSG
jgi:5,10-methylenetetrahydromethanopterin reductase